MAEVSEQNGSVVLILAEHTSTQDLEVVLGLWSTTRGAAWCRKEGHPLAVFLTPKMYSVVEDNSDIFGEFTRI